MPLSSQEQMTPIGEGLPFTLSRVEHRLRHQRPETHGNHKKAPTEYLRKNFYLTTSGVFRTQALMIHC
ncbi:hypothetical protein ACEPP6_17425 [Bacillus rugosus]|uniref:hypothetical protein n=1 Tax=Bacillus rugosus TaxID=2715209 RepID=UPI0035A38981